MYPCQNKMLQELTKKTIKNDSDVTQYSIHCKLIDYACNYLVQNDNAPPSAIIQMQLNSMVEKMCQHCPYIQENK